MASEIVITSVPRGVKLGRTGFQVAMQTAGMRDDVSKQLEKMAGYRHLPGAVGGNPVSYFHRLTRTVAGPLHVVGRIVDAGVDFSNRSNKLAHMVVLEAAEAAGLAASSPAAALAAIEGRLASSWPGGPEERQFPFSMAGLPASQPAPCGTWQQLLGDAGWAGVIADRALRNQPTLIVSPDPSPASCRRLLALFEEALALVPPAKRWAVTFDTTTLAPDGILWRGTYAGSPESAATQPGLLVLELARPQPIPAEAAASDLVAAARTGRGPMPQVPPGSQKRVTSAAGTMAAPRGPATVGGGPTAAGYVPPPPNGDTEWVEVPLTPPPPARPNKGFAAAMIIGGSLLALLGLVAVGTVAYFVLQPEPRVLPKPPVDVAARTPETKPNDPAEDKAVADDKSSGKDKVPKSDDPQPRKEGGPKDSEDKTLGDTEDEPPSKPAGASELTAPGGERDNLQQQQQRAFEDLQKSFRAFNTSTTGVWPLENVPTTLIQLNSGLAKYLPIDGMVLVGTSGDFKPTVTLTQDKASHIWTISFKEKDLARLKLDVDPAESRLVISKTGDDANHSMRYMPIGFKYPTAPLHESDWFHLSKEPTVWPLASGTNGDDSSKYTLRRLLCEHGTFSRLPATGLTLSHWNLRPRKIAIPGSPITLTVTPDKAAVPAFIDLTFTATESGTVGKYALHERITLSATDRRLTIQSPWGKSSARLGRIDSDKDPSADVTLLGLRREEKGSQNKGNGKIPNIGTTLPKIVMALLKHNEYFEGINVNGVKGLLKKWVLKDEKDAWHKDMASIEEMRLTLETYLLRDNAFKRFCHQKFAEGRPEPPVNEADPAKKLNQEKALATWRTDRDNDFKKAVGDRGRLQEFWGNHKGLAQKWENNKEHSDKDDGEKPKRAAVELEELAAIKVLFELDGMIFAKLHREDLESLLQRVPASALLEGHIEQVWELDGKPLPPVVAYKLIPDDPLPAPATAPAPGQAAERNK